MRPDHGTEPRGLKQARSDRAREGRFGFMFKKPPPFEPPDELLKGLAEQMREPQGTGAELESPIPAGFTFFGQFVDHDMTFDTTPLEEQTEDQRLGLASGQAVAKELGEAVLSNAELGVDGASGWNGQAPLWFYLLKESELVHQGQHLCPVGGRIVGEVIVGLIHRDRDSYLHPSGDPGFRPSPPLASTPGQFAMADFLKFAGVP